MRYNIAVHSEYFIIEPTPGTRLEVKGDVTAVGMASEEETLKVGRCRLTLSNPS